MCILEQKKAWKSKLLPNITSTRFRSEPKTKPRQCPTYTKKMSVLRIQAEEGAYNPKRKTYTFINKNLDIITNPCEAYLYCTAAVVNCTSANGENAIVNSIGVPCNAGIIHGFSWDINDTTITFINDNLSSTLYAVHSGVYAASTTQLDHIGYTKDDVKDVY